MWRVSTLLREQKKIRLKRPVVFSKQGAVALVDEQAAIAPLPLGKVFGKFRRAVEGDFFNASLQSPEAHALGSKTKITAPLTALKGKVFLTVSFKREVESFSKPNDAVIGIDRGINVPATVTDGQRQLFFGGGHTNHLRRRYAKTRACLQKKKAQTGSRSTRRALKRLSGRERRFQGNGNHVISRRPIEFTKNTGNPTIALEEPGGIRKGREFRKKQRTDLNRWAFYELERFIRYKAETFGMAVIGVDPKHTSQGCFRCGHTEKANRYRHRFLCRACGYELHADLNASRNIRLRGVLARQALDGDGPMSCGP